LVGRRPGADVVVAFVNNMPDGAFNATERQFLGLLDAGSGELGVEVRPYSLAGVPRGEVVARRIAAEYRPLAELWASRPDAVIVTGSNPLAPTLAEEPYWAELARVIESFTGRVDSMLLSCLSAHAALQLLDGVPRVTLPAKCTGVFPQDGPVAAPLTAGLPRPLVLPHSRLNDVPVAAVRAAGYQVLLGSASVGWSLVAKQVGRTQLVLVQGHPEYDPSSLVREYRRDVERWVDGTRSEPPCLPKGCVSEADRGTLEALHADALAGRLGRADLAAFPFEQVAARAGWPWRAAATRLYANWLAGVAGPARATERVHTRSD
jgi:homoserine O-succinyltransferase